MSLNRRYTVTVGIDVETASPLEAAKQAFADIKENGDIFTYVVVDDQNQKFDVDLLTDEVKAAWVPPKTTRAKEEAKEREAITSKTVKRLTDRTRPYDGQPHTAQGERGKTELQGLTYRDAQDCVLLGMFLASGLGMSEWPDSVYRLSLSEMDPVAIAQNVCCELERRQGIYPNIPSRGLTPKE